MTDNTIQMNLFQYFLDDNQFTVKEATNLVNSVMKVNNESIRARIYEGVEKGLFEKVSRGVYKVTSQINGNRNDCLLINGDGRDLSMIPDNSIDGIITDHPYDLSKALTGGNRKFASYELFKYNQKDFEEKQRVLKDGAFLVEFLPEESEINYKYLFECIFHNETSIRYGVILAEKSADVIIIFLNMSEGEGYEKGRHSGRPLRC